MRKGIGFLSGNQIKILALIAMTCDHAGKFLFPDCAILQIIGRLAYPIFAYMIAEGCTYTKNRKKYLGLLALSALLCQTVYLVMMHSLYQCIMVTFTLSVVLIYLWERVRTQNSTMRFCIALFATLSVYIAAEILPRVFLGSGFYIDYGFFGVMLPVIVYFTQGRKRKLAALAFMLALIASGSATIQWFSFAAIPILACYNQTRGKRRMKYFFYIYYPAHMALIYLISLI